MSNVPSRPNISGFFDKDPGLSFEKLKSSALFRICLPGVFKICRLYSYLFLPAGVIQAPQTLGALSLFFRFVFNLVVK